MRTIVRIAFALNALLFFACQQVDQESLSIETGDAGSTPTPVLLLDSVPTWVKQKVSEENYAILEDIKSKYRIDYSSLQDIEMGTQQEDLYRALSSLQEKMHNHPDMEPEYLSICFLSAPAMAKVQGVYETTCSATIYQSRQAEAAILLSLKYTVDMNQKKFLEILSKTATATGRAATRFEGEVSANISGWTATGDCSGVLYYNVNNGNATFHEYGETINHSAYSVALIFPNV